MRMNRDVDICVCAVLLCSTSTVSYFISVGIKLAYSH